jgi:uncharacterized protein (DUF1778 family)
MAPSTARTEKLDLRISPAAKLALRRAAAMDRKSVSDFVLDSALEQAERLLAEQTRVDLSEDSWLAFMAALDAPATAPDPRLVRLLNEPSVFER